MVYIIAEAGIDHDGSIARAYQLIEWAASSGADAFKTQYYKEGMKGPGSELPWLTEYEMLAVAARCRRRKIDFLCTPHDTWALDFLEATDEVADRANGVIFGRSHRRLVGAMDKIKHFTAKSATLGLLGAYPWLQATGFYRCFRGDSRCSGASRWPILTYRSDANSNG